MPGIILHGVLFAQSTHWPPNSSLRTLSFFKTLPSMVIQKADVIDTRCNAYNLPTTMLPIPHSAHPQLAHPNADIDGQKPGVSRVAHDGIWAVDYELVVLVYDQFERKYRLRLWYDTKRNSRPPKT
ncbi:hypothetical protein AcV5_000263 [Taiwanofungus camphoratus]|nr:hypothetical protein AcV5_000263 [Antrodia cinnamomea]